MLVDSFAASRPSMCVRQRRLRSKCGRPRSPRRSSDRCVVGKEGATLFVQVSRALSPAPDCPASDPAGGERMPGLSSIAPVKLTSRAVVEIGTSRGSAVALALRIGLRNALWPGVMRSRSARNCSGRSVRPSPSGRMNCGVRPGWLPAGTDCAPSAATPDTPHTSSIVAVSSCVSRRERQLQVVLSRDSTSGSASSARCPRGELMACSCAR